MGSGSSGIYGGTQGSLTANQGQEVRYAHVRVPNRYGGSSAQVNDYEHSSAASPSIKLEENGRAMRKDYGLEDGYFAQEGSKPHLRVFKCSDPLQGSRDFYERISQGGVESPLPNGAGVRRELDDGTWVNYRTTTKTPGSPAVQISKSKTPVVRDQKVHFKDWNAE